MLGISVSRKYTGTTAGNADLVMFPDPDVHIASFYFNGHFEGQRFHESARVKIWVCLLLLSHGIDVLHEVPSFIEQGDGNEGDVQIGG